MPNASRRLLAIALAVLLLGGIVVVTASPPASGQSIAGQRAAAQRLRAAVDAESRRIGQTQAGIADAERRLAVLVARVDTRWDQLTDAQNRLVLARARLSRLERKEAKAKRLLSENLRTAYKTGRPNFVTVVMSSRGFDDLLHRVDFFKRISRHNAGILDDTRDARAAVAKQAKQLDGMRVRYSRLAKAAMEDRDRADVIRTVLLRRQAVQLARRSGAAARLASVRSRIATLERRQAAAARAAMAATSAGSAAPSAGPPAARGGDTVARVVAAATQIATTPYVYGGGHGGSSGGYDCSGSISYALAAGGLLGSPLSSGGFMSWGEPGVGRRITVYANAGHAFMVVDGRRYDTTALSGGGTRWTSQMRSTAGFVARHPPGL